MILGRYKVRGHSMEPTLHDGSVVFILGFLPVKKNNIIVFRKGSKYFIKRATKLDDSRFYVEGDNKNDSLDSRKFGWIEKKDIVGRVLFVK